MAEKFAYGDDTVDGCPCPVMKKYGEVPSLETEMAEWYDTVARDNEEDMSGTISEEKAKQYWKDAIDAVRDEMEYHESQEQDSLASRLERLLSIGEDIEKNVF